PPPLWGRAGVGGAALDDGVPGGTATHLSGTPVREAATATIPGPASDSPAVPSPSSTYPIDLSTALRLAEVENPAIAEARAAISAALALQQSARALLLPTLNAG